MYQGMKGNILVSIHVKEEETNKNTAVLLSTL